MVVCCLIAGCRRDRRAPACSWNSADYAAADGFRDPLLDRLNI
jgi:hypothetical protein